MDISALSIRPTDYSWYTPESGAAAAATAHDPSAQWPQWSQEPEPLDSFGKAPKGGAVGKGGGKTGTGKNNAQGKEAPCHICGRTSHKWRDCWWKDEKDPKNPGKTKGQVAEAKGGKGKGKKGKYGQFYRKTGINYWEEVAQEDAANVGWQDGEDTGLAGAYSLCLGCEFEALDDEDDGLGCCRMFQEADAE